MKKEKIKPSSQLLKPSAATIFRFEVVGIDLNAEKIGNLNRSIAQENNSNIVQLLKNENLELAFDTVPNSYFAGNLQMIDTYFPEIMAWLMLNSYLQTNKQFEYAVKAINSINPLQFKRDHYHNSYSYKINVFLLALASGMLPNKVWDGNLNYISIKNWIIKHNDGHCNSYTNLYKFGDYILERVVFEISTDNFTDSNGIYLLNDRYYLDLALGLGFISKVQSLFCNLIDNYRDYFYNE